MSKNPQSRKVTTAKPREQAKQDRYRELINQLRFMGANPSNGKKFSRWGLPANAKTGSYTGGCNAGSAAAIAFLKFLRERVKTEGTYGGGYLQHVVLDMLPHQPKNTELRGQVVGFFSALDYYLQAFMPLVKSLDDESFAVLAEKMEKGMALTKAGENTYFKDKTREWRAQAARQGWKTRRAAESRA